jgi:ABC-type lipoprotein release transport system permease subunit
MDQTGGSDPPPVTGEIFMEGSNLGVMAWRNIWRNLRRTVLTLSSIAFGTFLAVISTGIQDRNFSEMIDLAARMGGGHVTIQHKEYQDYPTMSRTVENCKEITKSAFKDKQVKQVVTRITGHTMISTAKGSYGAGFMAINPLKEDDKTLSIIKSIVKGSMFATSMDRGIILGERLAKNLGAKMGSKVVYTMTDRKGDIVRGLAHVSGIIRTGAPGIDSGLSILPIDSVRKILGFSENEAIQVAVFIEDQRKSKQVAKRLSNRTGTGSATLTWNEVNPELAGFISMKIGGAIFMEMLIAVLVAAGIFNTLFVSVMERLREFGIMMAIGFSPGSLFRLVMLESLWLALVGLVSGTIVTAGPYYYLASRGLDMSAMIGEGGSEIAGVAISPIFHVGIFPEHAVLIAGAVFITTMLSGLYPAWRAGRVVPVDTIKLV